MSRKIKKYNYTPNKERLQEQRAAKRLTKLYSVNFTKYRTIEGDRLTYSRQANPVLNKYRKLLDILYNEYKNLKLDIKLSTTPEKQQKAKEEFNELRQAYSKYQNMEIILKKIRTLESDLDTKIKQADEDLQKISVFALTDKKYQELYIDRERRLKIQKNKLEVAVKRFDNLVAENAELQKKIDHKIRYREYFKSVWNHFINNLSRGNFYLEMLFRSIGNQYSDRLKSCLTIEALHQVGKETIIEYSELLQECEDKLDKAWEDYEYFYTKCVFVYDDTIDRKREKRKQKKLDILQQKIDVFNSMIKDIQEYYGMQDINEIYETSLAIGNQIVIDMMALGTVRTETYQILSELRSIRDKYTKQRWLDEYEKDEHISENLKNLMVKREEKQKLRHLTEHKERLEEEVLTLLDKFDELLKVSETKPAEVDELLGDQTYVNEFNCMGFLKGLENHIADLFYDASYENVVGAKRIRQGTIANILKRDRKARYKQIDQEEVVPYTPCPLCMETGQVAPRRAKLQKPLSTAEIRVKLARRRTQSNFILKLHPVEYCQHPRLLVRPECNLNEI